MRAKRKQRPAVLDVPLRVKPLRGEAGIENGMPIDTRRPRYGLEMKSWQKFLKK
jgi:hypothetical protein